MIKYLEKQEDFNEIIKGEVLVDFYADWCGPCKMMGTILEEIDFVDVLKVNVDDYPEIATKYGVMSIPTLIKFKDGEEVKKTICYKTKDELETEYKN